MFNNSSSGSVAWGVAMSFAVVAGCASPKAVVPVVEAPVFTSAKLVVPPKVEPVSPNLNVSEEIARVCNLHFNDVGTAPKFAFDESVLASQDGDVLSQIATCVTTGPLQGRRLTLVGRADPRGEVEYNMALGERRASSVRDYLGRLGVPDGSLLETSRGKLDATGTDEMGWMMDRRVDVLLQ